MSKKALLLAAAISSLCGLPSDAQTVAEPTSPDENSALAASNKAGKVDSQVNKAKIIESLQSIKKDPSQVKFHCAMCYDMVMPAPDITLVCPNCGENNVYPTESFPGAVSERISTILRTFKELPVKISVNSDDFCHKCSKDKNSSPSLKFTTSCLECEKKFAWNVNNVSELDNLKFLCLKFPITDVDAGQMGPQQMSPEELGKFISERFFCPDCLEKLNLK